jgi:hypothetical protein
MVNGYFHLVRTFVSLPSIFFIRPPRTSPILECQHLSQLPRGHVLHVILMLSFPCRVRKKKKKIPQILVLFFLKKIGLAETTSIAMGVARIFLFKKIIEVFFIIIFFILCGIERIIKYHMRYLAT